MSLSDNRAERVPPSGSSATQDPGAGARAFALAGALCGVRIEPTELLHRFGGGAVFSAAEMIRAAALYQVRAKLLKPKADRLSFLPLPAVALMRDGHWVVIARMSHTSDGGLSLLVQSPGERPEVTSAAHFQERWSGSVVLVSRRSAPDAIDGRFGLTWFFGSILRYRRILLEVLMASLALQVIGLVTPLFFQVVVDKVLVHRGTSTLDVIATGLAAAISFDVLLTGLRTYLFSHTANRVDVELGSHLFSRLLRLPIGYFGARRVGDSVARIRELENIRQFITGSTLTLVLDLLFAIIFLAVIYIYSVPLGMVVTGAIPVYAIVSAIATPALRLRIEEKFRRGAENQAFLVETVTGIETIKSMAVEPLIQRRWEDQLAGYVKSGFRVATLGTVASQVVQFFSKLTTLLILYIGAKSVMSDHLTVGGLVAVNMLAGQISSPVLRLAQVWQDFQQVKISVDRVGDIMNTPPEPQRASNASARPALTGAVSIEDVRFRYRPDAPPALDGVSLTIPPGQILGVVGPSGSGKSTITKLVQRLHLPEVGRVMVDDLDVALVDPMWLRRQIGVVLQESVLFNGTVRENIALADPGMPMERVVAAARLAGAHDFISAMPGGYDAAVGERGATLSGGQRQRIAIARALITQPRILIFDEATSALDLDSEQAIQENMAAICRNRTVIIVAHRLTAVRNAHRIITVEQGRIVEDGAPLELLKAGGRFARLFEAQGMSFVVPDSFVEA